MNGAANELKNKSLKGYSELYNTVTSCDMSNRSEVWITAESGRSIEARKMLFLKSGSRERERQTHTHTHTQISKEYIYITEGCTN
jgi:hypothetical protein